MSSALVHLVDDDDSFATALARLLRAEGLATRTFASATQLLEQISADASGCVVADLHMPGMNGLELQDRLAVSRAPMPIVFLTGRGDVASSVRAMKRGAVDFLEKCAPKDALLGAVRLALQHDAVTRAERDRARALDERFGRLTQREREVLQHVVTGKMNKEIAAALGIHERTIKLHRTSIKSKLGVHSSVQLAVLVQEASTTLDNRGLPQTTPA